MGKNWRLLMAFFAPLLAAMLLSVLFSPAASAHPLESCITFIHNVEGTDNPNAPNRYSPYYDGLQANVWFGSAANDCDRVTSLGVASLTGADIEWGWILGWVPRGPNLYTGPGACNDSYVTTPEVFVVWSLTGYDYNCRMVGHDGSGVFNHMSLYDNNHDSTWTLKEGGVYTTSAAVGFYYGFVLTNGERHSASDSMWAHFVNLQDRLDTSTTWKASFTNSVSFADDDLDYYWVGISSSESYVSHT